MNELEDVLNLNRPAPPRSPPPRERLSRPYEELLDGLADELELPKRTVRHVVEMFNLRLSQSVWERGRLRVPDLATFSVRKRKARPIVDPNAPRAERRIQLPAHEVVLARVAKSWRRRG